MFKSILPILKTGALLLIVVLAGIAILYICNVFTGAEVKQLMLRSMAIIGILTSVFLAMILLAKN